MSTLQVNTIKSNTTSVAPLFQDSSGTEIGTLCRAWVACNGSSTILAAFNVSSITDSGVGGVTVNFTTAMIDANYAVAITSQYRGSGAYETQIITSKTASACNIGIADIVSGAAADVPYVGVSVFR